MAEPTHYVILDKQKTTQEGDVGIERPEAQGSKRYLKNKYGGIDGFVAQYLRFMANRWQFDYNTHIVTNSPDNTTSLKLSNVEEIKRNYDYYLAQQQNYSFDFLRKGSEGQELPAPWTAGHEIYQVVQHMLGPMQRHFTSAVTTVESLDPSVQSKRVNKIAMLEAKKKLPQLFQQMQGLGAQFVPEGGEEDLEMAIEDATRNPVHKVEKYGLDILNHVNNINTSKDFFPKRYKDVVIGKYCGIDTLSHNGRIEYYSVMPNQLVWDRTNDDDDYNRYSMYKGYITWMSKEEIMSAYDLGKDAESALKEVFDEGSSSPLVGNLGNTINGATAGFSWLETTGVRRAAIIKGYFVARIKKNKDEWYTTYYQGTLIGNRILADFGEGNNIVYDKARPEWPTLPLFIFSPDTIMGQNVCPVDRFRQIQDDADAYMLKVRQKIEKDAGKTYVIWAEALGGNAVTTPALISDLKQYGITVMSRADGEEPIIQGKPVEIVDLTLDPNVEVYIRLRKEAIQDMKDVVSQSNITQGLQQTYIGGGTQQQTVSQASNGTIMLLQGFFQFYAMYQEYILNVAKTMLLDVQNEEEADLIFNKASKDFMKSIKDLSVADLQARVELEDIIDEEERKEYNTIALAAMQNVKDTGFTVVDYLTVKTARTTTELKRKLKSSLEAAQRRLDRQRQEDMQMQMAMQQNQLAAAAQGQQQKDQSSAEREIIRQTPNMEKVNVEKEKLNMERNMQMSPESGFAEPTP